MWRPHKLVQAAPWLVSLRPKSGMGLTPFILGYIAGDVTGQGSSYAAPSQGSQVIPAETNPLATPATY